MSLTCTRRASGGSTSADTETPSASASRTSVTRFGLAAAFSSATRAPLLTPARAASWSADSPRPCRSRRTVAATSDITPAPGLPGTAAWGWRSVD